MISFVVPFYKSEDTVRLLYDQLCALSLRIPNEKLEFVFIEDCGGDSSWDIIREIANNDTRVKAVQFSRNFGQNFGIAAGLALSAGDWTVVMDGDLQDRPEEIPRLYAKAMEGYDIVHARRGKRKDPLIKRATSRLFSAVFAFLSDIKYDPQVANFCILSRKVVDAYCAMQENLRFFRAHIQWLGFNTAYVDVQHGERVYGESNYNIHMLLGMAIDAIIAYSDKPLRFSIKVGFLMSLISLGYALLLVYQHVAYDLPVLGWTSIMVSIWFSSGLIIANLGIIGVYLGKVFEETKRRPLYIISKRINA